METPPARPRKSSDIECLNCGAFNIPENKICGRCGANLPLVYDEQGRIFHWHEAEGFDEVMHLKPASRKGPSAFKTGWILRAGVILFALLIAFILHHR